MLPKSSTRMRHLRYSYTQSATWVVKAGLLLVFLNGQNCQYAERQLRQSRDSDITLWATVINSQLEDTQHVLCLHNRARQKKTRTISANRLRLVCNRQNRPSARDNVNQNKSANITSSYHLISIGDSTIRFGNWMRAEPALTNTQQLLLSLSFVFRTTAEMQVQMLIMF